MPVRGDFGNETAISHEWDSMGKLGGNEGDNELDVARRAIERNAGAFGITCRRFPEPGDRAGMSAIHSEVMARGPIIGERRKSLCFGIR